MLCAVGLLAALGLVASTSVSESGGTEAHENVQVSAYSPRATASILQLPADLKMVHAGGSTFHFQARGPDADAEQEDVKEPKESITIAFANDEKERCLGAPSFEISCTSNRILEDCNSEEASVYCEADGTVAGTNVEVCLTHCSCVSISAGDDGFADLDD